MTSSRQSLSLPPDVLRKVRSVFFSELRSGHERMTSAFDSLRKGDDVSARLLELSAQFHRIAGTAAAVELAPLGHLCAICEKLALVPPAEFARLADVLSTAIERALIAIGEVLEEPGPQPRPPGPAVAPTDAVGHGQRSALGLWKVVVIDDDPVSAKLVAEVLREAGIAASCCFDPKEALAMVLAEFPDLIVLDVAMPGVNGFEFCKQVRAHPGLHLTPIIFVTGKGELEARLRGLEVGGNDYISKPFVAAELVARVQAQLTRQAELHDQAIRDGVTGCFNHRHFKARLAQEMSRARRYGEPMAVGMIDLDFFKRVNDAHGHPTGDAVLAELGAVLREVVRDTDVVARYGGEEFGVLFVGASLRDAETVSNRIRDRVSRHSFQTVDGGSVTLTVSIGVAALRTDDTWLSLLKRADDALYSAKGAGRDRVVAADAALGSAAFTG